MDAAVATLVRLHEAQHAASSLDDSQSQARDEAERRAKAFAIVAADADRLKKALTALLQRETAVDRSAYDACTSFLSLVKAVFWALGAQIESADAEKLRASVFVAVLQLLHTANTASLAQPVVSELLQELHSLHIEDLASSVTEIVRGVTHAQRSQHRGDALAVYYTIELLPQLLLRVSASMSQCFSVSQSESGVVSGPDYRKSVIAKLSELQWPRRFFLQVLKIFRDFSFTEDEERLICIKIYREARKELDSASDRVRALEIFPTICLNLLQLVGRTHNTLCSRLLTRLLINKCQLLTPVTSTVVERLSGLDNAGTSELSERDIRALQSTVLFHVDMAMRQWEKLGKAVMVEYEQRFPQQLTTFDIALLLLIANHPKHETQATQYLVRYVVETYTAHEFSSSDGHDEAIRRKAFITVVQHAQDGSWTPIIQQVILLGFRLIECRGLQSNLFEVRNHSFANPGASVNSVRPSKWVEFGARLLLACFQYHEVVREKLLDRVVNMIVVQNTDCGVYIYLLSRIVNRHVAELGGSLDVRIRECLEYVIHMEPNHAYELLVALSPLFKSQHNLKNLVILMLRKAMFRKDEDSRIIAIQGFALLLCLSTKIFSRNRTLSQLYSQNVTALSQNLGVSSSTHLTTGVETDLASQEHPHALAAEELYRQFCGIFRRALQLQSRVRLVLYAELVRVFTECPALQHSILTLLFQHYLKYYEFNESVQPPLKLDLSLSRKRGVYEEPLQYLLHSMLYCLLELKCELVLDDEETAMDEIAATQANSDHLADEVEKNVSVLFERLKRCDLTDFEFDKNSTFSGDSELGETNQRLASLVMGILEVAINWSVTQSASRNGSGEVDESTTWQQLLRYSQIYVWVQRKLIDPDSSLGDMKATKKRKLEKVPTKAGAVVSSDHNTNDSGMIRTRTVNLSFERYASLKWATLVSPNTLLWVVETTARRMSCRNDAPLGDDEEELLLFLVTKSVDFLELIQRKRVGGEPKDSKRPDLRQLGGTKQFDEELYTRRLCIVLSTILHRYSSDEVSLATLTTSESKKRNRQDTGLSQQRMRRLIEVCVVGFGLIGELWTSLPPEEFEEQLIRALCLPYGDCGSPDYDLEGDEDDGLPRVLPPLQKLVEALLSQGMPDDANRILDIIRLVWMRISDGSSATAVDRLKPHIEWVQTLLVTRVGHNSPRLLDKLITLLLCPHPWSAFRSDLAQQLARALRRFCNNEDESTDDLPPDVSTTTIEFGHLSEKHMLTVANGLLGKIEDALSHTERTTKTYDNEQRRHTVKLKEDDLSALQQLEDETGSQIFAGDGRNSQANGSMLFKRLCKDVFDLAGALRPFVAMNLSSSTASNRIIRLVGRLFKLLVMIIRDKVRRKDATLPKFLRQLFDRMAGELSPALLQFIQCVHEESNREGQTKKRPKKAGKNATGSSKFIPEVIYQLEQFDVVMIKLSKLCRGYDFNAWCKLRPTRDFRLDKGKVQQRLNEANQKNPKEGGRSRGGESSDGEGRGGDISSEDLVMDVELAANANDEGDDSHSASGVTESDEELDQSTSVVNDAHRRGLRDSEVDDGEEQEDDDEGIDEVEEDYEYRNEVEGDGGDE